MSTDCFCRGPGLVPSSHTGPQIICNSTSRGPDASSKLFRHGAYTWYTNIHHGRETPTHARKNSFFVCLFVWFCFVFLYVAMAVLELKDLLPLPPKCGIKGVLYHPAEKTTAKDSLPRVSLSSSGKEQPAAPCLKPWGRLHRAAKHLAQ